MRFASTRKVATTARVLLDIPLEELPAIARILMNAPMGLIRATRMQFAQIPLGPTYAVVRAAILARAHSAPT